MTGVGARPPVSIAVEDPRRDDVRPLIAALDAMMGALYPAESNHLLDASALATPDVTFVVARLGGQPVGCGAVRRLDGGLGEIKRMWTSPSVRGRGIGRRLLAAIEDVARQRGLTRLALETGIRQPEALRLYEGGGYRPCPPFGGYREDRLSVFLAKDLEPIANPRPPLS